MVEAPKSPKQQHIRQNNTFFYILCKFLVDLANPAVQHHAGLLTQVVSVDGWGHMEATCSTAIPRCTRIQCNLRVKRPQFQAKLLLPAGAHTLFGLINSGADDNIMDEDLAFQL